MTLTTVDSSMAHAVGYDEDERELEVIFNNGGMYRYRNVDPDEYEGPMEADSKGRYMRAHIIDVYPYYKSGGGAHDPWPRLHVDLCRKGGHTL